MGEKTISQYVQVGHTHSFPNPSHTRFCDLACREYGLEDVWIKL